MTILHSLSQSPRLQAVKLSAIGGVCFLLATSAAFAQETSSPAGHLLLRVTGLVQTSSGETTFDLAALDALPQTSFETTTIWTDGLVEFSGVLIADFLAEILDTDLAGEATTIEAVALNAYAAQIPISDAVVGGPILATRMDGELMSVRDKGPIWIVYPYDADPDYRTETIFARSVWQVAQLNILE